MRTWEIVAGLVLALIFFLGLKVLGLVIKFALVAAFVGFIIGIFVTRAFMRWRRTG